jgi:superfamily II DNA helicase RecQ
MARAKPQHLHQMAGISGIGQVKLDRYGEIFLEVVRAHHSD